MVGKHFLTMTQEYARARSIHDSIFPDRYEDRSVQFEYVYAPMRELGGDFVHFRVNPKGFLHLTLVDVTGHGLPAALTVNRLYGELERILAEDANAAPGDVIALLNRYIHLTLSQHNIFATGVCMRLDPYVGELRWSSAGHPPAFLRGANGVITELEATNCMLGALPYDSFEPAEKTVDLSPGDVVIAYTDGAYEVRDAMGKAFGLERVREMMRRQPPPRNWPQLVASAVSKHSAGRSHDDVLIAAITFLAQRLETASGVAKAVGAQVK
jgi:serine phosphatase RsbU (regulator of sigma subunit)